MFPCPQNSHWVVGVPHTFYSLCSIQFYARGLAFQFLWHVSIWLEGHNPLHLRSYYLKTLIQARIFYLVMLGGTHEDSRPFYPVYIQGFWTYSSSILPQKMTAHKVSAVIPSVGSFLIVREDSRQFLSSLICSIIFMSLEGSPQL